MALFNRVADPRIGGTYMTMLNTLANLGGQWPGTLVLATKGAIEASGCLLQPCPCPYPYHYPLPLPLHTPTCPYP